jgi:hypothetical protein
LRDGIRRTAFGVRQGEQAVATNQARAKRSAEWPRGWGPAAVKMLTNSS